MVTTQIDWYVYNNGSYHITAAGDRTAALADSEHVRRWLLAEDQMIVRAAAVAVGSEALIELAAQFTKENELVKSAMIGKVQVLQAFPHVHSYI